MASRDIILIDEDKCNGCGQCILACAEGALELVDGKARLVGDILCDGLGACLGECPEGAMTIIQREAEEFDEEAVEKRLKELKAKESKAPEPLMACGCPSSQHAVFERAPAAAAGGGAAESALGHWPVKLVLANPAAPFLKGADLLLLADCAATAYPRLHQDLLPGKAVTMGCPKFDNAEAHIEKLAAILEQAKPASLTVVIMEVPCCKGLDVIAREAIKKAGSGLELKKIVIARSGEVKEGNHE